MKSNEITRLYDRLGGVGGVLDTVGDLPTILLELDPMSNFAIKKTYIYGNSQILAQHDGSYTAPRYFYLHDRLGSVRLVIDASGHVKNRYTYNPFGELHTTETEENILNPFKYTGQYFDSETGLYYFRARMYDPYLARFTAYDPINGKFEEPLSLHKYLYCQNEPINRIDPLGLLYIPAGGYYDRYTNQWFYNYDITQDVIHRANELVGTNFITGPYRAFARGFDGGLGEFDYKPTNFNFELLEGVYIPGHDFGNWLAGYTLYYNYGLAGEEGARDAGHWYSLEEYHTLDDLGSRYCISGGILMAQEARFQQGLGTEAGHMYSFLRAKWDLLEAVSLLASQDLTSNDFDQELMRWTTFWNSSRP